jgi:hypothetical protein
VLVTAAAVAFLAALTPASAQQVKEALKLVPKNSLGFILVNKPGETSVKLGTLAKNVGVALPLPRGGPLELLKAQLGISKSLDEKGVAVLAVLPSDDPPKTEVVLFLPVTDYKHFLKEIKAKQGDDGLADFQPPDGEPIVIGSKGSHAVLWPTNNKPMLKKMLSAKGEGSAPVTQLADYLGDNDVSAVVTPHGLKVFTGLANEWIKETRDQLGIADRWHVLPILKPTFDFGESFSKRVERNVVVVAAGVQLGTDGGVHVGARALFKKGGEYAKAAAGIKGIKGGPLAGLPDEPFVVAVGGPLSEKAMKGLTDFMVETLKVGLEPAPAEKAKKLQDAYAGLATGLRGMGFLIGTAKGKGGLFGGMAAVKHVEDASAYLKSYEKSIKAMNDVFKDLQLFPLKFEVKKTKVGGVPALEVVMDIPVDAQGTDAQKKIMEAIAGPGGKLTMTVLAANQHTILLRYAPAAGLKGLLKAAKGKGLAGSPDVAKTLAQLPAGAQWVGLYSPSDMVELTNEFLAMTPKLVGQQAKMMPTLAKTPPVGYAVKLAPAGLDVHVVFPVKAIQALGRLVREMEKLKNSSDQ